MRIDGTSRSTGTGARSATGRAGSPGAVFTPDTGGGAARVANVASAAPAAGIAALIALQAADDPLLARKKAVRHGRSLLDLLDGIKADLLAGQVGEGRLTQLTQLIGQARQRFDPELDALLDDIELRVRVELAKFGKYPVL